MNEAPRRVVFDCNIFAQAIINPIGPAGACVELALSGQVALFISDFVLDEIRKLPDKPTPRRIGVTSAKTEALMSLIVSSAVCIAVPAPVFVHPIDPDDSHYVNLAIAATARIIVSRDRHLLNLNNPAKPWSTEFRRRYPSIDVITAEKLLEEFRREGRGPGNVPQFP